VNPEHLPYFRFVGRLVGKALWDDVQMEAYFTRSFYKHMLRIPVSYEDIEALDPDFYKNLRWVIENDITNVLDLTFSTESHFFDVEETVDLKPNGRNVQVTEGNKKEYVDLLCQYKMTHAIQDQINAFVHGFEEIIPHELASLFGPGELELLISGLPEIDIDDLAANTEYVGYSPSSLVIQWFWAIARSLNQEDRARLLQFCTGTSRVPLEGFNALQGISGPQRFQIHRASHEQQRLISAHTCFNQLDLPEYESKEALREKLMLAVYEASEGFGFQ
jgi:E3 ubiquitin-protein ligase HUWE1